MTQRGLEMVRISPLEAADDRLSTARTVADVMRRDVSAVSPGLPIERAGRVLLDRKTPALPVVDQTGRVVGVFGEEDLLVRLGPRRHHPWGHVFSASDELAREFRRSVGTTVADVMTHPVVTASPTLPLASAALLFDTPSLRLVPVVAADRLVGTVSRRELLGGLVSEPTKQMWQCDLDLVTRMQEWMAEEHPWVPMPRPAVSACNGLLILWGLVDTQAQKEALETMARAIPGCGGVESHLVVVGGTRLARRY